MAQPSTHTEPQKLRPPIPKSDNRQIHRLTKLRNEASRQQKAKPNRLTDPLAAPQDTPSITQATTILQLTDPPINCRRHSIIMKSSYNNHNK
jgi:hypothetical protein